MQSYLDILKNIKENGIGKIPQRAYNNTEVEYTVALPSMYWRHDMSEGFPLMTHRDMTKQMLSAAVELNGFLQGITSKQWYKDNGCHYWDHWANPQEIHNYFSYDDSRTKQDLDEEWKYWQKQCNDLGRIYPHQLRNFGGQKTPVYESGKEQPIVYTNIIPGFDQLKFVMDTLKTKPYDRGIVVNYWNPNDVPHQALRTCHYAWQVVVIGERLHLHYNMRSCDFLLGHNCHSYGLLLCLLSNWSGFEPGILSAHFQDCHIYHSQFEVADKILQRKPKSLPTIRIHEKDPTQWQYNDYELFNYDPHPPIKMPKPVV